MCTEKLTNTRFAEEMDLKEVNSLFKSAISNMISKNIFQWDEFYPNIKILEEDIRKKEMRVTTLEGKIVSVFVLNKEFDPMYETGDWKYKDYSFKILHRLCVHPDFQNSGIAKITMNIVFDMLKHDMIKSLRFDGFALNPYAIKLYKSLDCNIVGNVQFRKGEFYLYEKLIT